MHIVIAICQKRVVQGRKDARFIAAEMIRRDQVQCRAGLRLVLVVPMRVVPPATGRHLFGRQTEKEEVFLACLLAISMVAPSRVPIVKAPFIMNFMLLVPLAS